MSFSDHGIPRDIARHSGTNAGINTPVVGSYRRRLYDTPSTPSHFDMETEILSVREQTATLSSRALMEGLDDASINESVQEIESEEEVPPPIWPENKATPTETSALLTLPASPAPVRHPEESKKKPLPKITPTLLLSYLPSVALGLLLNILDGLSYGMILFPMGLAVFQGMESTGLSLFYVSTIVSQLVFSFGASKFESCVGSEMIEIVPFFHSMATTIALGVGTDDREAVLATTITAFAVSAIVTGMVFLTLGYLKLGTLVGFFPTHILVGCIGGVGWFLVATGVEVAARLPDGMHYDLETLSFLLEPAVFAKWASCLALAIFLMYMERVSPNPMMVSGILIATFLIFHAFTALLPYSLQDLRDMGWVFPAQPSGEPWYHFYTLYKFNKVHWLNILEAVPAMFALTFFGVIHVPINIPALAAATKNDDIDVNQELIAHGISNTISGCIGSIQNYLVYTNSVMFIKSGADNRIAGFMLAAATFLVMMAGPVIIGYIPVIVVAALIFMMGLDLMAEALVDTWGKVNRTEYLTIVAIVLIMGCYDFVVGIFAGIMLACLFFVISSARNSPVRATYTGENARSTIRRHPVLQRFLSKMGSQVHIIKLQGALFFGTNVAVEKAVRDVIEDAKKPIKYLIIDVDKVTDIDFCSADTFARIQRLADARGVRMIISGAMHDNDKVRGLRAVDLIQDTNNESSHVHVFPSLNYALEWCENKFLEGYYRFRDRVMAKKPSHAAARQSALATGGAMVAGSSQQGRSYGAHSGDDSVAHSFSTYGATPRQHSLRQAAELSVTEDLQGASKWTKFQQPMPLLMQVVEGLSDKDPDFWFRLVPFFTREQMPSGSCMGETGHRASGFYIVERGVLRSDTKTGFLHETILPGTTFGELPFFARTNNNSRVIVESDAVLWKLDEAAWSRLCKNPQLQGLAIELMQVAFALVADRFNTVSSYMQMAAA